MKFRKKHVPNVGYFLQVKTGILTGWKTVGKHTTGFGLYPEACIDHPMERESQVTVRKIDYIKWLETKNGIVAYKEL